MSEQHGTTGYRKGCRCEVCKKAHNEDVKRWRGEHPEATTGPVANAKQRAKYAENPEPRRASARAYYWRHVEERRAAQRARYRRRKEQQDGQS